MASVLKITDGTTTVDFLTDAAYSLTGWQPAIATRRAGELGGRGPYNDVAEEMTISISGASALQKLASLQFLMEKAQRWSRGESRTPVRIHYKPTAGSEELRSVILGAAGPTTPMVEVPDVFSLGPVMQMIEPVTVRFRRMGLWLGAEVSKTAVSAVFHPAVATITGLTAADSDSPITLELHDIEDNRHAASSFILFSGGENSNTNIIIKEAALLASAGQGFTSVSDASNKFASILRYTPVDTSWRISQSGNLTASVARRWGVFICYRNNSATTSFEVQVSLTEQIIFPNPEANLPPHSGTYISKPYLIPAGVSAPRWVHLGMINIPAGVAPPAVILLCKASAASGSIDFSAIALLAMDSSQTGQAIAVLSPSTAPPTPVNGRVTVDHALLNSLSPVVYHGWSSRVFGYGGDATLTMEAGVTSVSAAWLACGVEDPNYWRATDNDTPYTTHFSAIQRPGYIVPE